MELKDFQNLPNFNENEVVATGASIANVQYSTLYMLQQARNILNAPINLLRNGLTSGGHKSILHPNGLAVDFTINDVTNSQDVIKVLLTVGFKGVGVYHWKNGSVSFHADQRKTVGLWFRKQLAGGDTVDLSVFREELLRC